MSVLFVCHNIFFYSRLLKLRCLRMQSLPRFSHRHIHQTHLKAFLHKRQKAFLARYKMTICVKFVERVSLTSERCGLVVLTSRTRRLSVNTGYTPSVLAFLLRPRLPPVAWSSSIQITLAYKYYLTNLFNKNKLNIIINFYFVVIFILLFLFLNHR